MRLPSFALLASLAVFVALCGSGCGASPVRDPKLMPVATRSGGYEAGVAVADITPPLHLSLFGHGPESRVATGVRLRLRCEVFVVVAMDQTVALVPCDLQSPSMALQREIADDLRHFGIPIGADRIFLMATHTHAGPAHYFEARRYSGSFSSSIPGYDPAVVTFLATRIAAAITTAFTGRQPACLGWTQEDVSGLTFNRSYVPFMGNQSPPGVEAVDRAKRVEQSGSEPILVPSASACADCNATTGTSAPERAVDTRLSVLRIDQRRGATCGAGPTLGAFAVYAMHPTGVANTNELYHGDIFGFAVRTAEACLAAAQAKVPSGPVNTGALELVLPTCQYASDAEIDNRSLVAGLANGVDGDVSPKLDFQSVVEARKLGRALGTLIAKAAAGVVSMQASGPLVRAYWELAFPRGHSDDDPNHDLCAKGELGMAAGGGAPDGPTRLRVIPAANAGYKPPQPSGCHRFKLALREGTPSKYDFPLTAPIALLQIGPGVVATAPGEMTTVTGARIRKAIGEALATDAFSKTSPLVLVGLTNQYLQYFATREEYDFQYYEGASTLYGPNTEKFLERHFACLAHALRGQSVDCVDQPSVNTVQPLDVDPSPVVQRLATDTDIRSIDTSAHVVHRETRAGGVGWEMEIDTLPLAFTSDRSLFRVEVLEGKTGETSQDDDLGASIEVREIDFRQWRIRWIPDLRFQPSADDRCGKTFRLAVRGRVNLESPPFTLVCDAPAGGDSVP